MGEPAESTLIMADREQKEEPVIKEDTISLSVKLPNGLPYLLPMLRASETVQHLKQLVLEMPEFCHITSCHLEAIVPVVDTDLEKKKKKKTPSVILHESKLLSECSELREGYCLKVVCDGYTRQGIVEHINRLRWIIANPRTPFTNVGMVDSVENNTDSPERVEETKGDTKHVSIEENDVPSSDSREQHKLTSNDPDLLRRKLKNERKEMLQKLKKEIIPVPITLEAFFPGDEQESNGLDASTLSGIEWKDDSKNILCFESISFSGWNPPPRCRELVGDLAYIQVNAAESNAVFHVTATFDGFYVNASRHQVFNPEPSRNPFHSRTMVELLQKISPSFKKNFSLLFEEAARKEKEMESKSGLGQFDLVTLGVTAKPDETFNDAETQRKTWLKPMKCPNLSHSFDLNRSYEGVHDGYGIVGVERGMLRDWNDEYQLCIEMPSVTIEEKMQRCAAIDRIQKEFVEAAINAVRGILNGHIPPINPDDPPHVHAYVYNQIFISLASFRSDDTTVASYSASNQDLLGVKSLNEAMEVIRARESAVTRKKMSESAGVDQPIPGREKKKASLHTLATVLIDSLGCRFIAQSIIPGILQNEQNDLLVYGSVDYGQTVKSEADAHGLWQNAVEPWYIGKSDMMIQGKEISLFAPVECKGIRGSDDRIYALDLLRLTPFDLNYYEHRSEYHNKSGEIEIDVKTASRYLALLRPELIQLYARYRELENQQKQILEHKEKMSKSKTNKDQDENASEKAGAPAAETNSTRREIQILLK